MSTRNYQQKNALAERILALTHPQHHNGAFSEWNNRIGEIAGRAGLPLEIISWHKAPRTVALDLVGVADSCSIFDALEQAVQDLEGQ